MMMNTLENFTAKILVQPLAQAALSANNTLVRPGGASGRKDR